MVRVQILVNRPRPLTLWPWLLGMYGDLPSFLALLYIS